MNKRTRQFYQMMINLDYYYYDGYEFINSFCQSFIKHMKISEPESEHYDLKWKYKQYYFKEDCQIDCAYGFNRQMDQE